MWEQVILNVGIEVFQGETRVTGRVLLVEQELLTLPVHLCLPRILVAFVFFLLVIVLSVSHCPFGIFKLSSDIQQVGKWWYYEKFMGQRCD
jgi:hypothetical protein